METPPRTWRRPLDGRLNFHLWRNTSTDVEKTLELNNECHLAQKHLHGRGEDGNTKRPHLYDEETPPRTWRRLAQHIKRHLRDRNTSTDVEKTS